MDELFIKAWRGWHLQQIDLLFIISVCSVCVRFCRLYPLHNLNNFLRSVCSALLGRDLRLCLNNDRIWFIGGRSSKFSQHNRDQTRWSRCVWEAPQPKQQKFEGWQKVCHLQWDPKGVNFSRTSWQQKQCEAEYCMSCRIAAFSPPGQNRELPLTPPGLN